MRYDVIALEKHAVVTVKDFPSVGLVVLAAKRDHYALRAKRKKLVLEVAKRRSRKVFPQRYTRKAVFPDNSTPKRIVTINNDAFFRSSLLSVENGGQLLRQFIPEYFSVRLAIEIPFSVVERPLDPKIALQTVEVQSQHVSCQRHLAKPFVDDTTMKCSRLARAPSCVNMMICRMGKRRNRYDNRARKRGPEMGNCCPQIGNFAECGGQRVFITAQKRLEQRT